MEAYSSAAEFNPANDRRPGGFMLGQEVPLRTGVKRTAGEVAYIFNSAVAAWAISAAWEIGALDELNVERTLDAREFAARHRLDPVSVVGMFRSLAAAGVINRRDAIITPSENFDEVFQNKSFFHWLSRGTAELFRDMPFNMHSDNRVGKYFKRDSAAVAFACREIDEICYAPTFWAAIERLDFDFNLVADLGCGSGGRIMEVLNRYPGTRGIGIDIAAPALKNARSDLAAAGLSRQTTFVEGDVLNLPERPEFAEVDLLTCFMMGHDFWPRDRCVATLRKLRQAFPSVRRFLLGDATRTVGVADAEMPVFTLGFEFGHELMGVVLPTIADWESVIEESGWTLLRTNHIDIAVNEVIFELQ